MYTTFSIFSFKIVQKQKSSKFILGCGWCCRQGWVILVAGLIRGIFAMVLKWTLHHHYAGYSKLAWCARNSCEMRDSLFFACGRWF